MQKTIVYLSLFLFCCTALAQTESYTDSLLRELKQSSDTNKIIILNKLSAAFKNKNPESAILYAEEALKTSKWLNFKRGIGEALNNLGVINHKLNNSDLAFNYHKEALKIRQEINDKRGIAGSLNNLANIYKARGDYAEAIDNYLKALSINKKTGNTKWATYNLNGIAWVYMQETNYLKALEMARQSVQLADDISDQTFTANALNLIGIIHKRTDQLDSAIYYFKKCMKIYQDAEDEQGIGISMNNIGVIYSRKGDKKTALNYYKQAYSVYQQNRDKKNIALSCNNIGQLLSELGKYDEAFEYLNKGMELVSSINNPDMLLSAYLSFAQHFKRLKQFEESLEYMEKYAFLQDSLNLKRNIEKVEEIQAKYDEKEKELKIMKLDQENTKQQLELVQKDTQINRQTYLAYGLAGIIALFLFLVLLILRGNKQKKKATELLALQNMKTEEVNKSMTESIQYAARIQKAVLPDKNELNKIFTDSFVIYKPKDIVSGDFYWFWSNESYGVLAVADCIGFGISRAFMSIIGQDLLNQIVKDEQIFNASQILRTMDHKISSSLNKKGSTTEYNDGMDIGILVFDKEKKTAHFSGANRPLYQVRGAYIIEHAANNFQVGGVQDSSCKLYYNSNVEYKEGDAFYLFTDGFTDQFGGEKGKKFMNKKFSDLLIDLNPRNMKEQEDVLEKTFKEWRGELQQIDDVLIVGVRA